MTHSPTPTELAALKVANAALLESRDSFCDMVATVVFALGSAQLLQSPETAAELARLRAGLSPEREEEIRNRRLDEVTAGPWLVADGVQGRPVVYVEKPGGGFPGRVLLTAVTASEADVQFVASARRSVPELLDEAVRLRARVAELEAERHTTNEALSDAAEQLRRDRDRIAELETDLRTVVANRDREIVAWLGKKSREYGTSNREARDKAEAVWRMADKLRRGAVRQPHEDGYVSPLHQDHKISHDLPEVPHA